MILAHNRKLFPYHKWLPKALESAPEKPDDLMACFNDLLNEPSGAHATALFEGVRDFQDWGVSDLEAYTGHVPFPLSPARAKGRRFDAAGRRSAGLSEALIEAVRTARSTQETRTKGPRA